MKSGVFDLSSLPFLPLAPVTVTFRTFGNAELRKSLEKDHRLRQVMGFERVPQGASIGRRLSGLAPEAEQRINLLDFNLCGLQIKWASGDPPLIYRFLV